MKGQKEEEVEGRTWVGKIRNAGFGASFSLLHWGWQSGRYELGNKVGR